MKCLASAKLLMALGCLLGATGHALAMDLRVEKGADGPPKDELSAEVAAKLTPQSIQVIRGSNATLCRIWLCKEWNVASGFKPTTEVIYPFKPGELIGVVKFVGKSADFRDQDIAPGVYTMRYAQQPVDGAHVGTSPTRDFLLLVQAEKDRSPAPIEAKELAKLSSTAAGSAHPALLSLQKPSDAKRGDAGIHHVEEHDWWIVHLNGAAKDGTKPRELALDLLLVGKAPE